MKKNGKVADSVCARALLTALLVSMISVGTFAATKDGALRVEVITAYNLVVDSNAGTPSSYAPQSAYVGATFYNDGITPITDVQAFIGDFSANTPGYYPRRADDNGVLVGPLPGGEFALTHEGGSAGLADATRYLPEIPPGGSVTVYWLVGYDQLDESDPPIPLWGKSVKPDDDLWLEYDVWATGTEGAATRNVDITRTFTFRNEISASANKIFPNGANKVPDYFKDLFNQYVPAWTNANYDGSVGTRITTEGIWYDFGNVGDGFDNNGDLVPDRNAWMQPVGNPAIFDSGAFRLVQTYAYVIVKLKSGSVQVIEGRDQLYFENLPEDNVGVVGFVQYYFMPLLPGARSVTSPYQEVASGFDNEKFNADYGVALGDELISGDAIVLMDKTASVSAVYPGNSISYMVAYTNTSPNLSAGNRDAGVPLVIQDKIPEGTVYVENSAENSNTLPAGYNNYKILYSTDGGLTWTADEDSITASDVTHIQWWLDNDLAPEDAGAITFSVTVKSPFNETDPLVYNKACTSFGNTKPFACDDVTTPVLGDNTLGDTVFADTGDGGGFIGNGVQDGTETGIGGISVYLYYDSNGNGVVDAGEPLLGTEITAASTGYYQFTDLPDGKYVAVVDTLDTDLQSGYTVTTVDRYSVDLDSGSADANPVDFPDADFGFAPALSLTKVRDGSGTLYEGQQVSYTITVTNSLYGDGSGIPTAQYTVWPTNGTTLTGNKAWTSPSNAWMPPQEPDGLLAVAPFANAGEELDLDGYSYTQQPGAITNVTLVIPMQQLLSTFTSAHGDLDIDVLKNGTQIGSTVAVPAYTLPVNGVYELDITSYETTWEWANFNGSVYAVRLIAQKMGNPSADLGVDSVGFRLTTDQVVGGGTGSTTLNPVPLDDFYDPAKLQFVSAVPSPDSVSTNSGVGTLYWNNLGPIFPGGYEIVSVTFKTLEPAGNGVTVITNTASITEAFFQNGVPANEDEDEVVDTLNPAGTIGDYVWRDLDSDGSQDTGEPGVGGVTVQLTPPAGTDIGAGIDQPITTVTDGSGYYLFEGLTVSGTYTVTVLTATLPGGTGTQTFDFDDNTGPFNTPHSTPVTIDHDSTAGGDTMLDADFGYNLSSLIRGTVWHDVDHGLEYYPEPGEELFEGVTVRLYLSDGTTLVATTTTAADGTFKFTGPGVTNGTYVVKVDDTTGPLGTGTWYESWDTDGIGSASQVTILSLDPGGEAVADFSYYQTGAIAVGDTLFYDWNGNSIQDPATDAGISGITIRLYEDENTNGVVDAEDALVGTTVTSTNGWYLFEDLAAGTYNVIIDRSSAGFPAFYNRTADPDGGGDDRSTVSLTATNLLQDFGYQPYGFNAIGDTVWFDANADGVQSGATETGIAGATVRLYIDANNDGTWTQITNAVTDSDGKYLFDNLPDGSYRVAVDSTGSGIPNDAFGNDWSPTTVTSYDVSLSGSTTYLDADFGFAPLGAIGDTIYWDTNGNGTQDWNEPGIPGVSVDLYYDNDGDKVLSAGDTPVPGGTATTDSNGNYLFTGLIADDYVVVVDETSTPIATATLTADPENDGAPCPIPAVPGPLCDAATGVKILPGTFFMGADFGYQPSGVIGDLLWIDLNTNGVFDAGEQGIPYVTVEVYDGVTLVATNVTDGSGFYNFENLPDGTYTVKVVTTDPDFPADLTASYDADGTPDSVANDVVIDGGHITSIGGTPVSTVGLATDLSIDFGYSYNGDREISGTIGMDATPFDGLMNGTNPSGPGTGEYAFSGVSVYLLLWDDDGDGTIESGEYTTIATTTTDSLGDYNFSNLPAGDAGDKFIVSMSPPSSDLRLTTTTGGGITVVNTTNAYGNTVSAYQVLPDTASRDNVDFAFTTDTSVLKDFGDLPVSYSTTVAEQPVGPSHTIVAGLYLGNGVTSESNGQPTSDATGDTGEDGVTATGIWSDGAGGGSVQVLVGAGSGWLVAWVDFNQDGTFTNANELIVDQAVSSTVNGGVYEFSFNIPTGTLSTTEATLLNARFRLYAEEPFAPTFFGTAEGGDVEDYQFIRGIAGNYVWEDLDGDGIQDVGEPGVSNVTVNLYASDGTTLLQTKSTAADGGYFFNGLPVGDYVVKVQPPVNTAFTRQDAGADPEADSDVDATGDSGTVSLTSVDPDRTDIDAGLYIPAQIFGYVFEDEDENLVRNSGDTTITNQLVALIVDGVTVSTTYTDADGYYEFLDVPAGVITVQVVQADAQLIAVPSDEPFASDEMRNRAISNAVDTAVIGYSVVSGYGVLSSLPGEPLNFGYFEHPLSTRIDLRVYVDSSGKVMIEISTVNENGNNDIEIYAMIDGQWVLVANVLSEQIVGFGSNTYTVEATGLVPGQSYLFKIVDEAGHIFETDTPVTVAEALLRALATSLDPESFTVTFDTDPFEWYLIMVSDSIGPDAVWTPEYVQVVHPAFPQGVSDFYMEIQGAPEGTTTVRIPRNRDKAFFKIIKIE